MKVLVTVAPQALWQGCMAQFALLTAKSAALSTEAQAQLLELSQTPAQLAELLSQYPQAELAVAYEAPEVTLGRLLESGNTPEQAAQQWFADTEALLQLQQKQRKRVTLFNLTAVAHCAALPDWIILQTSAACVTNDTVYNVLAAQLLRQLPQHTALQQRLVASSLPLTGHSDYQIDLTGILRQISDNTKLEHLAQAHQHSQQQLKATSDERDLLLLQLQQVQEELEQLFQKKTEVKQQYSRLQDTYQREVEHLTAQLDNGQNKVEATSKQLSGLQAELERMTLAHNQSQQQLDATSDERDLLLLQLQQVQEELEQLFQKKTEVRQQYARLQDTYQREVEHLTAQLDNGQNKVEATSKQLSGLQAELERITLAHNQNQQQLEASSDERDLLLLQLQQVQEELEQYYLKWQQTQVKLQQAEQKASQLDTARDKQQQRELTKLESQLRKTKARAAGAEHQLQLLQHELGAVKNSTLWKSTAPVRVLKRLVKKTDKAKEKLQQEAALIITSEYFDIDWYLSRYPDVAQGNINPAEHYLKFGAKEGRMPGPLFDGEWYLQRYPDVAASDINPLLHFIKFGQVEGRSASPKLLEDHSEFKQG